MDWYRRNRINNPFKTPDEHSDAIVKCDGMILHLHTKILAYNSPVFDVLLNQRDGVEEEGGQPAPKKEVTIANVKAEHVIEFFKFFYPELFQPITEKTAFVNILQLCKDFQVDWLSAKLAAHFINKTKKELEEDGLNILYIAERFDLIVLKEILLKHHCISISFLGSTLTKDEYMDLSNDTKLQLAKLRLAQMLQKPNNKNISITLTELVTILEAIQDKKQPRLREITQIPFDNVFKIKDKWSDIVLKIGKHDFHSHKWILARLSTKFKELIAVDRENPTELELNVNKERVFLLMVRSFYPKHSLELTKNSPIVELYEMCTYFKVEWLKQHIEYRVTEMANLKEADNMLWGLQMADRLNMRELKNSLQLLFVKEKLELVKDAVGYQFLQYSTRYTLAKWRILRIVPVLSTDAYIEILNILKELDKIILKQPDTLGNNLLHNAHGEERE